jgi:hypothetical protein
MLFMIFVASHPTPSRRAGMSEAPRIAAPLAFLAPIEDAARIMPKTSRSPVR